MDRNGGRDDDHNLDHHQRARPSMFQQPGDAGVPDQGDDDRLCRAYPSKGAGAAGRGGPAVPRGR